LDQGWGETKKQALTLQVHQAKKKKNVSKQILKKI
jgi:hypothetical protein